MSFALRSGPSGPVHRGYSYHMHATSPKQARCIMSTISRQRGRTRHALFMNQALAVEVWPFLHSIDLAH